VGCDEPLVAINHSSSDRTAGSPVGGVVLVKGDGMEIDAGTMRMLALIEQERQAEDGDAMGSSPMTSDWLGCDDTLDGFAASVD
jgi:hypothetical protein